MHSEMLHMLLYKKKDWGRPIKIVESFYNLRFFICSSIRVTVVSVT